MQNTELAGEIPVKRLTLSKDGFICDCPGCGGLLTGRLTGDELSYPTLGEPEEAYTMCKACGVTLKVVYKLRMTAELVSIEQ